MKVYVFMGYRVEEKDMYDFFRTVGFELIFKPVLELKAGEVKGNLSLVSDLRKKN